MDEMVMISITLMEYEQLKKDSLVLSALNAAGVDNWVGWDSAMEIVESWKEENNE